MIISGKFYKFTSQYMFLKSQLNFATTVTLSVSIACIQLVYASSKLLC